MMSKTDFKAAFEQHLLELPLKYEHTRLVRSSPAEVIRDQPKQPVL